MAPDEPRPDESSLSEEELDSLLLPDDDDSAPPSPPPEEPPATVDEAGGSDSDLDEVDLDALLLPDDGPHDAPRDAPEEASELNEEELDALLMHGADDPAIEKDALDDLMTPEPLKRSAPLEDPPVVERQRSGPPEEAEPATRPATTPEEPDEVELDKATLDALMAEAGMEPTGAATGLDEVIGDTDYDAPIAPVPDEIDTKAAGVSAEDLPVDIHPRDAVPEEVDDAAALGVSEAEIDQLVSESAQDAVGDENRAAAADSAPEDLLDDDALSAMIDQAVHEAQEDGSAPAPPSDDIIEPPAFEPDEEPAASEDAEPPMDPDIAAAIDLEALMVHDAAQAARATSAGRATPAPSADDAAKKTPSGPAWQWPRVRMHLPRIAMPAFSMRGAIAYLNHHALRLATALSTGMVVSMAAFTMLYTNQVRQPSPTELAAFTEPTLDEAIAQARARIEDGQYAEALALLGAAMDRAPASPAHSDAAFLRIQARYGALDAFSTERERLAFHGEVDEFELSHSADPRVARALAWQAQVYEREGQPYDAQRNYRKIESNYPNYDDMAGVMLGSARLALALNQPDDALASLENLMRSYPGAPSAGEARLLLADTYIAQGDRRRGRELLESIARTQSHTGLGAAATARLARLAFEEGRYDDAIEMLEARRRRATTVEGNDEVYLLLAHAYRDAGRSAESERVLRELIDFFPDTPLMPQAYLALSSLLERDGRRDEALRLIQLALDRFENDRAVMLSAADLLQRAGRPLEAAELYMRAESMERGGPDLLLRAGRAYLEGNEPATALETLGAIADAFPGTPEAIAAGIEWARASHQAGNPQGAMTRLRSLRDQTLGEPAQAPVLLTMAAIYRDLGLRDPLAEVQREVAALTNEPQRVAEAAIDMIRAGMYEPGFAAAERVDPESLRPETAYTLLTTHAEALLRTDAERAIATMERALAEYPSYRTTKGDRMLFDAYLATNQPALARVMLADLEQQARRDPLLNERAQELAATLGDYHYRRGDYRAALDAYTKILDAPYADDAHGAWAAFQRANTLVRIREYDDAAQAYEEIVAEGADWANEAELRLGLLQIERRLRTGRRPEEPAR